MNQIDTLLDRVRTNTGRPVEPNNERRLRAAVAIADWLTTHLPTPPLRAGDGPSVFLQIGRRRHLVMLDALSLVCDLQAILWPGMKEQDLQIASRELEAWIDAMATAP